MESNGRTATMAVLVALVLIQVHSVTININKNIKECFHACYSVSSTCCTTMEDACQLIEGQSGVTIIIETNINT